MAKPTSNSQEIASNVPKAKEESVQQSNNILNRPQLLANICGHRRSASEALMDAHEVVVHVVKRNRVHVVLDLLGESVGQLSEPSHDHAHC